MARDRRTTTRASGRTRRRVKRERRRTALGLVVGGRGVARRRGSSPRRRRGKLQRRKTRAQYLDGHARRRGRAHLGSARQRLARSRAMTAAVFTPRASPWEPRLGRGMARARRRPVARIGRIGINGLDESGSAGLLRRVQRVLPALARRADELHLRAVFEGTGQPRSRRR